MPTLKLSQGSIDDRRISNERQNRDPYIRRGPNNARTFARNCGTNYICSVLANGEGCRFLSLAQRCGRCKGVEEQNAG